MTVMARFLNEANNGVICKSRNTFVLVQMVVGFLTNTAPFLWSYSIFLSLRQGQLLCQIQARKRAEQGSLGSLWFKVNCSSRSWGRREPTTAPVEMTSGFSWQWAQHESFRVMASLAEFTAGFYWGGRVMMVALTCSPSAHTMSNTFSSECKLL